LYLEEERTQERNQERNHERTHERTHDRPQEWNEEMDFKNEETFADEPIQDFDFQARDFDPIASFKAEMRAKDRRPSLPSEEFVAFGEDPIAAFKRMMKEAHGSELPASSPGESNSNESLSQSITGMESDINGDPIEKTRAAPSSSRFAGRLFAAENASELDSMYADHQGNASAALDEVPPMELRNRAQYNSSIQSTPSSNSHSITQSDPAALEEQEHFSFIMNKLSNVQLKSDANLRNSRSSPTYPEYGSPDHYLTGGYEAANSIPGYSPVAQHHGALGSRGSNVGNPSHMHHTTEMEYYEALERERATKKKANVLLSGNIPTSVARNYVNQQKQQQHQQMQQQQQFQQQHLHQQQLHHMGGSQSQFPPDNRSAGSQLHQSLLARSNGRPIPMDLQVLVRERAHINIMQQLNRDRTVQQHLQQQQQQQHQQQQHSMTPTHAMHTASRQTPNLQPPSPSQYHHAMMSPTPQSMNNVPGRPRVPPPPGVSNGAHMHPNAMQTHPEALFHYLQSQQMAQLRQGNSPTIPTSYGGPQIPNSFRTPYANHPNSPPNFNAQANTRASIPPGIGSYPQNSVQTQYHIHQQQLQHMLATTNRPPRDL
jgi:hypothetical protein